MENTFKTLGLIGEELAAQFLRRRGYKVLMRNYECSLGEIDLVARQKDTLVFVEVKTRSSEEMGLPAEGVTFHKRRQVIKCAKYYMKRYGLADVPCRFDVVSVLMAEGREPVLEVIADAFGEGGR